MAADDLGSWLYAYLTGTEGKTPNEQLFNSHHKVEAKIQPSSKTRAPGNVSNTWDPFGEVVRRYMEVIKLESTKPKIIGPQLTYISKRIKPEPYSVRKPEDLAIVPLLNRFPEGSSLDGYVFGLGSFMREHGITGEPRTMTASGPSARPYFDGFVAGSQGNWPETPPHQSDSVNIVPGEIRQGFVLGFEVYFARTTGSHVGDRDIVPTNEDQLKGFNKCLEALPDAGRHNSPDLALYKAAPIKIMKS